MAQFSSRIKEQSTRRECKDYGISGTRGHDKRPAFDKLCRDAAPREFEVVMAWSVDRLGRSSQDLVGFLSELRAVKIDLFLRQQGLDTTAWPRSNRILGRGLRSSSQRAKSQTQLRISRSRDFWHLRSQHRFSAVVRQVRIPVRYCGHGWRDCGARRCDRWTCRGEPRRQLLANAGCRAAGQAQAGIVRQYIRITTARDRLLKRSNAPRTAISSIVSTTATLIKTKRHHQHRAFETFPTECIFWTDSLRLTSASWGAGGAYE
jgi:Resolvase, N terminal domain